jgi:hypothetical protein
MYLRKQLQLKSTVISRHHASPTTGHSGFTKTYESAKHSFFWDGMKYDVYTFVVECDVVNATREKHSNPWENSNCFQFPPLFGGIFIWISLLTYLN